MQLDVHLKAGGVLEGLPAYLTEQSIRRHVTLLVGSQVLQGLRQITLRKSKVSKKNTGTETGTGNFIYKHTKVDGGESKASHDLCRTAYSCSFINNNYNENNVVYLEGFRAGCADVWSFIPVDFHMSV